MKIIVASKLAFDNYLKDKGIDDNNASTYNKVRFISIHDKETEVNRYFKESHKNVLNLTFDDIDEDNLIVNDTYIAEGFKESDAENIISFLEDNYSVDLYLVHCAAGISRSGAVGAFISDYFNIPYSEFLKTNPYISPNARVSRILNAVYRKML